MGQSLGRGTPGCRYKKAQLSSDNCCVKLSTPLFSCPNADNPLPHCDARTQNFAVLWIHSQASSISVEATGLVAGAGPFWAMGYLSLWHITLAFMKINLQVERTGAWLLIPQLVSWGEKNEGKLRSLPTPWQEQSLWQLLWGLHWLAAVSYC